MIGSIAAEVFAIVVAVRRPNYAMDMSARRFDRFGGKFLEVERRLVIELDQNHRTLDSIVEDAVGLSAADPGEPGVIEVLIDFVHLYSGMTIVQDADKVSYQVAQTLSESGG